MNIKQLIKEEVDNYLDNINLKGNVPKYITPLILDYVKYNKEVIGINDENIIINFKKPNKNEFGFVNFSNIIKGKNEIIVDKNANYKFLLEYISHELTHIKQIKNNELSVTDDYFIWKNKKNISISEYNSIIKNNDFERYKNLEWEREAYHNQNNVVNKYLVSDRFKTLVNNTQEPTLNYILQNILSV